MNTFWLQQGVLHLYCNICIASLKCLNKATTCAATLCAHGCCLNSQLMITWFLAHTALFCEDMGCWENSHHSCYHKLLSDSTCIHKTVVLTVSGNYEAPKYLALRRDEDWVIIFNARYWLNQSSPLFALYFLLVLLHYWDLHYWDLHY